MAFGLFEGWENSDFGGFISNEFAARAKVAYIIKSNNTRGTCVRRKVPNPLRRPHYWLSGCISTLAVS